MHDLYEDDIIRLLLEVVRSHRLRNDPDSGGMQVDGPSEVPSLSSFLAKLVVYTSSPPMLRLAFKMHLTDARDLICILEVLEGWLTSCDSESGLAHSLSNFPLDGAQASNTNKRPSTKRCKTPPLASVSVVWLCLFKPYLYLTLFSPARGVSAKSTGCAFSHAPSVYTFTHYH